MKKFVLFICLVCVVNLVAPAQEISRKLEIHELTGLSELILHGTITGIKGKAAKVEIAEVLKGEFPSKTIMVRKFKKNGKERRWGAHAEGEQVFLFLINPLAEWQILGINGEGEKLIMGDHIYLDSRGGGIANTFGYHPLPAGTRIYAEKVPVDNFLNAIKDFDKHFTVRWGEFEDDEGNKFKMPVTEKSGDPKETDQYVLRSEIHDKLVGNAYDSIEKK